MTVDIEKLEALAKAAIEQEKRWKDAGEPWPIWNKCLLEMQAAANPVAVLELIASGKRMAARLMYCPACQGQGEIYSGRNSYEGYNQPPEPIMNKCGECDGDGALGDTAECISILDELEMLRAELAGLKTGYEACERVNAELRAENEKLRKNRTDWQAECLKRGFEYVRESDDHYVLADVPEMSDLLGALLGVEVRSKDNDAYEEANSRLSDQIEGLISTIHAQDLMRKDAGRYRWIETHPEAWSALAEVMGLPSEFEGASDMGASIDAALSKEQSHD